MYYEEKMINGKWYSRSSPDGEWYEWTLEEVAEKLKDEKYRTEILMAQLENKESKLEITVKVVNAEAGEELKILKHALQDLILQTDYYLGNSETPVYGTPNPKDLLNTIAYSKATRAAEDADRIFTQN